MQTPSDQPSLPTPYVSETTDDYDDFIDAVGNADDANWELDTSLWKLAGTEFQKFKTKWYGTTEPIDDDVLSLGVLSELGGDFPSEMIVRNSYKEMFEYVWTQARVIRNSGVIITGQPGIGKSLFQFYLLVRLLQRKQIVLFSMNGTDFFLFYHDSVYTPRVKLSTVPREAWLPEPKSNVDSHWKGFIWSLLDITRENEPDDDFLLQPCFPVQTASPNPVRYKNWRKIHGAPLAGLPLWTRDELEKAFPYQQRYKSLLDALSSQNNPLTEFPGARALLDKLHEEDTQPLSPKDSVQYLLDVAIYRFGYSARDVFRGVFNYDATTQIHEDTFKISYDDLNTAVRGFSRCECVAEVFNRILVLSLQEQRPFEQAAWTVAFKSDWVARGIVHAMDDKKEDTIREQIYILNRNPQAKPMAGWFFEPLAHRSLARTSSDGGFWPLINMTSSNTDPPLFTVNPSTDVPDDVRFPKVRRKIFPFWSLDELPERLEDKMYYVPKWDNFPLADAFTIDLDSSKKSAVLWVIQITTSHSDGGSTEGYKRISDMVSHLKNQVMEGSPPRKKAEVLLQVHYLLVVPNDSKGLNWQLPTGWTEHCKVNDHCGDVYCLKIPP